MRLEVAGRRLEQSLEDRREEDRGGGWEDGQTEDCREGGRKWVS